VACAVDGVLALQTGPTFELTDPKQLDDGLLVVVGVPVGPAEVLRPDLLVACRQNLDP